jgi:hypothetical protein
MTVSARSRNASRSPRRAAILGSILSDFKGLRRHFLPQLGDQMIRYNNFNMFFVYWR